MSDAASGEGFVLERLAGATGAACPVCGRVLRVLDGDRCAACRARLIVRIDAAAPGKLDGFASGVLGLSAGAGMAVGGFACGVQEVGLRNADLAAALLMAAVLPLAVGLALWARSEPRLRGLSRPRRAALAAACWCAGLLLGLLCIALVARSGAG